MVFNAWMILKVLYYLNLNYNRLSDRGLIRKV